MNIGSGKYENFKKLNNRIKECNRCRLSSERIHAVCGEGNLNARLFFIAQAPGKMEDKAGKMFIDPTGKVFDELFSEISLSRSEVYMTNLIKCRLPKNRKPKSDEIELCGKYLEQEIEMIKPEFFNYPYKRVAKPSSNQIYPVFFRQFFGFLNDFYNSGLTW
jgi:uracil-DNA glycosylase